VLLTDLLTPGRIRIPFRAEDKASAIRQLVELFAADAGIPQPEDVLRAVQEREAVLSTGVGNGVAIPHGKSAAVPHLGMAVGLLESPVDFEALDGQPVRLVFLLVGPEAEAGAHIKALSRISRLVRHAGVREKLFAAHDADDFLAALEEAEGA
jgi:fructose-specific phosphotransferase system IIA component